MPKFVMKSKEKLITEIESRIEQIDELIEDSLVNRPNYYIALSNCYLALSNLCEQKKEEKEKAKGVS